MIVYDLLKITPAQFTEKKMNMAITANPSPEADRNTMFIFDDNISQNAHGVKQQFSISPMADGEVQQAEQRQDPSKAE